jgi:hypothetical protein
MSNNLKYIQSTVHGYTEKFVDIHVFNIKNVQV